jgi:hypothetical protein
MENSQETGIRLRHGSDSVYNVGADVTENTACPVQVASD